MNGVAKLAGVIGAIVALIGLNLWIAGEPIDTSPLSSGRQANDASVEAAEAGAAPDLSQLNLTQATSRPLFAQDRKPWAPPPAPPPKKKVAKKRKPAAKPAPPPNFRLIGISISEGPSKALVTGGSSPDPVWVAMGDAVDGWTVSEITPKVVKMRLKDRVVSIDLYPDAPDKP